MSHTDANWRSGGGSGPSLGGYNPGLGSTVDLLPFTLPTVNVFPISCGSTTDWYIRSSDLPPVYRSNNFADNANYHAANGTLQITSAGPVEITLTGITDAVLTRDGQHKWYADSGVISIDVPIELIGPFVLEVWSASGGTFSVHTTCVVGLSAYWTLDSGEITQAAAEPGDLPEPPGSISYSWAGGGNDPPGTMFASFVYEDTQENGAAVIYTDEVSALALSGVAPITYIGLSASITKDHDWTGPGQMALNATVDSIGGPGATLYYPGIITPYPIVFGVALFSPGQSSTIAFYLLTAGGDVDSNGGTITFSVSN